MLRGSKGLMHVRRRPIVTAAAMIAHGARRSASYTIEPGRARAAFRASHVMRPTNGKKTSEVARPVHTFSPGSPCDQTPLPGAAPPIAPADSVAPRTASQALHRPFETALLAPTSPT